MLLSKRFRGLPLVLLLLGCPLPAAAQLNGLPNKSPAAGDGLAQSNVESENPEQRLRQWLKEASGGLARLESPAFEASLPQGITPEALAERRRALDETVRTVQRNLSLLTSGTEAGKALEAARAAETSWSGFTEKPPYSVLLIDDLENLHHAAREKLAIYQSSASHFQRSKEALDIEISASEAGIRLAIDFVEESKDNPDAAKWHLDTRRDQLRLLTVRAMAVRLNLSLLKDQVAAANSEIALLERKLSVARKSSILSEDDLARVQKAADDRQAGLRREALAIQRKLKDAQGARNLSKAAFDTLAAAVTPETRGELDLRGLRLAADETQVEVLQFILDNLGSLENLESHLPSAYRNRKTLAGDSSHDRREEALLALQALRDRLQAWEIVTTNELAAVNADLSEDSSTSASIAADDPRAAILADQRAALWEKQNFLQRVSQTAATQRRSLDRWLVENDRRSSARPWRARAADQLSSAWGGLRRVWAYEVAHYDVEVSGGGTESRAVRLGTILQALLFFVVAYFISTRISRRLQHIVVSRGRIAEAQANTLRNWLMIVVGVLLAIATLNFLRIPLTVFAFLGGALAIGLGFGTQTLIKNFISGIIVLFERKIRVGDVLTVGGVSGTVIEINTRSSVLRGGDGLETLIPNSIFLENQITSMTLSNRRVRNSLRVGVVPNTSPPAVATILQECAERHGLILKDPAPTVNLDDFTDNSIVFGIYYWIEQNDKTDGKLVASDLRFMILKRFAEAGISMPNSPRLAPADPLPKSE